MPSFGKRIPLTREHFSEFKQCYGDDPNGDSQRVDLGEDGRFRCFTREQITKRNMNEPPRRQERQEKELTSRRGGLPQQKSLEELGWHPGFFEEVIGGWVGEPLERPKQGEYEIREQLNDY